MTDLADRRLRWLARRGMLELDTWLNHFLDGRYREMPVAQQRLFVYLLRQDDMTLFDWLSGSVEAPPELRELVEEIRATGTNRH